MSVINRMIDQALGLTPEKMAELRARWIARSILLTCPICKTSKRVGRLRIDPKAAVECVYPCQRHQQPTDQVVYLDARGAEVPL